jgi:hypothetical protein
MSTEQAAVSADLALPSMALADDSNASIHAQDATASAVLALAKDKQRQEDKRRQE